MRLATALIVLLLGAVLYTTDDSRSSSTLTPPRHLAAGDPAGRRAGDPPPVVARSPAFRPGEVLAANTSPGFSAQVRTMGLAVVETSTLRRIGLTLHRIRLPAGMRVGKAVARLRQRFPNAVVDANHYFVAAEAGAGAFQRRDPTRRDPVPDNCGRGIRVGMIDAAVDTAHPALRGADLHHRSFILPDRLPDAADHGTAVAALFVGQAAAGHGWKGLLPGAYLAAASIFELNEGGERVATARALLEAVDWIVGQRMHVINLSVAGPHNRIVRLAIERVGRSGSILVAAVGNWGSAIKPAYPAAYEEVIGITAVAADGRIYARANRGPYVEFAAPGVGLWTAVPGGGRFQSGTSFASPYVASMVGLARADGAQPHVDAIRTLLRKDTLDLGEPGRDDVFGWGLARLRPACGERPDGMKRLGL